MKRKQFIQWSSMALMGVAAEKTYGLNKIGSISDDDPLLAQWIQANDRQAERILKPAGSGTRLYVRGLGQQATVLASAYVTPDSIYFAKEEVALRLQSITKELLSLQAAAGTINCGNLESPPDTGFLVELLAAARYILRNRNEAVMEPVKQGLDVFLKKTAGSLLTGGVHTPNHRWVICSALSKLYRLYPNPAYLKRIDEWLGEGIYMDADGHYPERSAGIYAVVENHSLLAMATHLNRPVLLEYVRRNLRMTWYYLQPNGDVVTNDSRRQDQFMESRAYLYYPLYRHMAIVDGNATFAAIADFIASMEGFEENVMQRYYFTFLEQEEMRKPMPARRMPSTDYEKLIDTTHLLRIRRGEISATLFGGVDWPLVIASGRSNSPDFFSYRKGRAILQSLRLSTSFFSMGYFYSEGLRKEGNRYVLQQRMESPYYQPLPPGKRNKSGDYTLEPSTDGRFWNKMQFRDRPQSNVKQEDIRVVFQEKNGEVELQIEVIGAPNVPITLELCFRQGGVLTGVVPMGTDDYRLEAGEGVYKMGDDTIRFGSGSWQHEKITGLEGERYSTQFGSLRMKGMHVYLTGITPFRHTLYFR